MRRVKLAAVRLRGGNAVVRSHQILQNFSHTLRRHGLIIPPQTRTELGKNLHSCSLARSDIYYDMLDEAPERSNSASSAHEMKKRDRKKERARQVVARSRLDGRAASAKQASAPLSTLPPSPWTGSAVANNPQSASGGSTNFPIVGIGASADGLEALTQLLRVLPVGAARRRAITPEAGRSPDF